MEGTHTLYLNGIKSIDANTAKQLVKWKGQYLYLQGMASLDASTAQQLAAWKGKCLCLSGLQNVEEFMKDILNTFAGSLHL